MRRTARVALVLGPLATSLACATPLEHATRRQLDEVESTLDPLPTSSSTPPPTSLDGSLPGYVARAMAASPSLRASFEDWRAATHAPRAGRRLPEATITFAGFVRAVETRVGPQHARLGAMQWFPWPSSLGASRSAAALEAQASQRVFEAQALELAAQVSTAYWELWRVHRARDVQRDEIVILEGLAPQVRTRLEVGEQSLADVARLELRLARARDDLAGLDTAARIRAAELLAVVGVAETTTRAPVRAEPPHVAPLGEPVDALLVAVDAHPHIDTFEARSQAALERERAAKAERYPSVGVGVDWIITGPSRLADPPPDSGKDALALSLSVKVPLSVGAYAAAQRRAVAQHDAQRARALDARNRLHADVRGQVARLEDDVRRIEVIETALVPQAQTVLESTLASFATGRAQLSEVLQAEQELIGLQAEFHDAQADFGIHVAQLQSTVGRSVQLNTSETR